MPHYLDAIAASPWILAVVFLVAGLDAILPFMPSESTVVACGVAAANTGRPVLSLLIAVSAVGAYVGDQLSFRIGRRGRGLPARLSHRRARAAHDWVHGLLHRRGGLVILFARYLPGGRSATALAAGIVGYPAARFHWFTSAGVLIWAVQASLLGYLGGSPFADRPLLGLLLGWACAFVISCVAITISRYRASSPAPVADSRASEDVSS
jgi:membrane-associated protein